MSELTVDYPFTIRHDDGACTCGACHLRVRPAPREALGYVSFAAALGMTFVALPFVAVLPPLNMMMVPPLVLIIVNLWGHSTRALWGDRHCPACRKALVFKPS